MENKEAVEVDFAMNELQSEIVTSQATDSVNKFKSADHINSGG